MQSLSKTTGLACCAAPSTQAHCRFSPLRTRKAEARRIQTAASIVDPASLQMASGLISTALLGVGALMLLRQPQAHQVEQQPCPRCNGSGYEPCACLRWSDGDSSGCATCSRTGYARCRSCGGGGTAVPAFRPIKMPSQQTPY
ncbi:stress related protein [Haematococcus lacustris]